MLERAILPAIAFLSASAYWPNWHDGALKPKWAALSIGMPLALFFVRVPMTRERSAAILLLAWAALSMVWTVSPLDGVNEYWRLSLTVMAFMVGSATENPRPTYVAFIAAVAVSGVLAVAEVAGAIHIPAANSPAAMFGNKNYLAEAGLVASVLAIGLRAWWALPLTLAATLLPECRGVEAAGAFVAAAWSFWRWPRLTLVAVVGVIAAAYEVGVMSRLLSDPTAQQRFAIWGPMIQHMTFSGHGIGSVWSSFPSFAPDWSVLRGRPLYAHNEVIDYALELGLPGAALLGALAYFVATSVGETEMLALLGLFVAGMFGFPFHLPATAFIASFMAGVLCRRRADVRMGVADRRASVGDVAPEPRSGFGYPVAGRGCAVIPAQLRHAADLRKYAARIWSDASTGVCGLLGRVGACARSRESRPDLGRQAA